MKPFALQTCLSLLDLLSYRTKRLRSLASGGKVDTQPFETLIACHLVFRQSFGTTGSLNSFDSHFPLTI